VFKVVCRRTTSPLGFQIGHLQLHLFDEWHKVPICMQKRDVILDPPGSDERVNGLPDRDTFGS
jgi:hypothetical protein